MIYTIRTTSGREDIVVDLLMSKIQAEDIDIKSVFHPAEIKGYIFIEGKLGAVHKAMQGLMHSRGLIDKPINLGEIQHFLQHKSARIKVDEDDIVEIIGGPFKGEKGRIKRVNKIKDEVTAELLEASIPIPVTIATEFVKLIKKAHPEKVEKVEKKAEEEDGKSVFDKEELEKVGEEKETPKTEEKPKEAPKEEKEAPAEGKKDMLAKVMEEAKEGGKEEKDEPQEEPAEESPGPVEDLDLVGELGGKEKKKKTPEEDDE